MRDEAAYFAWVSPGRRIERLDDTTGRIWCEHCQTISEFSRADGHRMSNADLAQGWVGWSCACPDSDTDPDPGAWPMWAKQGHHRPRPGRP